MEAVTAVPKRRPPDPSAADVANTLSSWAVGAGVITIALFPLALPILALTAVALLPLLVPVLAVGMAGALVALPVIALRAVVRAVAQRRRGVSPLREMSDLAR